MDNPGTQAICFKVTCLEFDGQEERIRGEMRAVLYRDVLEKDVDKALRLLDERMAETVRTLATEVKWAREGVIEHVRKEPKSVLRKL